MLARDNVVVQAAVPMAHVATAAVLARLAVVLVQQVNRTALLTGMALEVAMPSARAVQVVMQLTRTAPLPEMALEVAIRSARSVRALMQLTKTVVLPSIALEVAMPNARGVKAVMQPAMLPAPAAHVQLMQDPWRKWWAAC